MKANVSGSTESNSNVTIENLDRLKVLELEVKRMASEHASLARELAVLRDKGNGNRASWVETAESSALTDRRSMLKTVAGLAVGVATVGLLRPNSSNAVLARKPGSPEATGGNMIIGQLNLATAMGDVTRLSGTSVSDLMNVVWSVENYGSTAFSPLASHYYASVGYINNNGTNQGLGHHIGVWGESHTQAGTAIGMVASGDATIVNLADSIPPKQLGDGGTLPGYPVGIYAEAGPGGDGVFGVSNGAAGSFGVHGMSDIGYGGVFSGGQAALELFPGAGAVANPNVTNPGFSGDLYCGSTNGSLWYCATGTNPYRRVADSTTAGALSLQAPQRLVDTRTGSGFAGAGAHLGTNTLQTYNIRTLAALPVGARGMVGRITIVNATNSGGLQESPNPPPGPGNDLGFGTAVVNYPPASTIPAFGVPLISALDSSGNIRIHNVMASGSADVIIDITGYYL